MDNLPFIIQQMMYFSIPLLVVALGGMFSERSGVVNIALEGIMLFGAFVGVIVVYYIQSTLTGDLLNSVVYAQRVLVYGVLVSGFAGAVFTILHAYASINMRADQIISGTALNLFAPALAIFVARSFAFTNYTQQVSFRRKSFLIRKVPYLGDIPIIGKLLFQNIYITTFIGIGILIISSIILYKTRFGLRLRSCGEHPHAAAAAGINVKMIRYAGVIISGFLGGIGGFTLIVTTTTQFNATVSGYGFLALAVLIFGQWKPGKILLAALFFGLMKTIASAYSLVPLIKDLRLPSQYYKMIPFIATLILLAFTSVKSQAPKAAGEIYDVGKR